MLGDYSAVRRELAEKDARLEVLEARMESEILGRRDAIALANAESARANAESARANLEAEVRREAVIRANAETDARLLMQEKFAVVEAELRKLQGTP